MMKQYRTSCVPSPFAEKLSGGLGMQELRPADQQMGWSKG
jgi:hypothetical protein